MSRSTVIVNTVLLSRSNRGRNTGQHYELETSQRSGDEAQCINSEALTFHIHGVPANESTELLWGINSKGEG